MRSYHVVNVSSWQPRQCGIYTFSHDLLDYLTGIELQGQRPVLSARVAAIDNSGGKLNYRFPVDKRMIINAADINSWQDVGIEIASFANQLSGPLIVPIQHEYGIDETEGKQGYIRLGSTIKERAGDKTILVLSAHTAVKNPDEEKKTITTLASLMDAVVVPSQIGLEILASVYGIPKDKLRHINHGIRQYDLELIDPVEVKRTYGLEGRDLVILTGFKSPGKGIPETISTFGYVLNRRFKGSQEPNPVLVIGGATHEEFRKRTKEYEAFQATVKNALQKSGLKSITVKNLEQLTDRQLEEIKSCQVVFWDRALSDEEYRRLNRSADIASYLYGNDEQISSGNLAEAVASRVAVMATPFPHAFELLKKGDLKLAKKQLEKGLPITARGIIVPFANKNTKNPSIPYAIRTLDFLLSKTPTIIEGIPYTARQQIAINARRDSSEDNWERKAGEWAGLFNSLIEAKFIRENPIETPST